MKTNSHLYEKIISIENLFLAFKKARKGKTKRLNVIEFEANLRGNLLKLHEELKNKTYKPLPLVNFIVKDPKTRKISKSAFRDRIVHHALVRIIEPIFERIFIYDSCANRIGKGTLFALKRFSKFFRKVTNNLKSEAFCLKADIKHYFQEVNHEILLEIIKRRVTDERVIWLSEKILENMPSKSFAPKGMPLGNLTSQFFANVYLNELDYFVKHILGVKYYLRYVDDFVILHSSKKQLGKWKIEIEEFLKEKLRLELHPQKTRVCSLSKGIDFVGFRNYWHHRLLRKRNIASMFSKIEDFRRGRMSKENILEIFQGWNAYAKWANSYKLRREVVKRINRAKLAKATRP